VKLTDKQLQVILPYVDNAYYVGWENEESKWELAMLAEYIKLYLADKELPYKETCFGTKVDPPFDRKVIDKQRKEWYDKDHYEEHLKLLKARFNK
tara:strand:- start:378 stop:662 length:285 start_codon:yes stop_codon:yes gene_type:complete